MFAVMRRGGVRMSHPSLKFCNLEHHMQYSRKVTMHLCLQPYDCAVPLIC